MANTAADIVNEAIQLVGGYDNNEAVTGVPPFFDNTTVGVAAGIIYNDTVATAARQFGWDFSRNVATLNLSGQPAPLGYGFEYIYPTNGIQVRQILPPTIVDKNDPRPYRWTVGSSLGPPSNATGSINFTANPSNGDTMTLNGTTFTFVTGGSSGTNIHIGPSLAATLVFATFQLPPDANNTPGLIVAGYIIDPSLTKLIITYGTPGSPGLAYTLATTGTHLSPSGATLSLAAQVQQKVIWTDVSEAVGVITGQPPESTWDALFTEAVVRLLASKLDTATAGKPESAQLALEQFGTFEKAGEERIES